MLHLLQEDIFFLTVLELDNFRPSLVTVMMGELKDFLGF
jgi:hypothetical protein